MEGFVTFINDLKDSISSLKEEMDELKKINEGQSDEMALMRQEITRIKDENSNLSQRLEAFERDTAPKVKTLQSKLKSFRNEFTKGMDEMKGNAGKIETTCERLVRLQMLLNNLHIAVQKRKNLEDAVEDLMSKYSGKDDCLCCHCKAQTQNGEATQASGYSKTSDGNDNAKSLCVVPHSPPSNNKHPSQCTKSSIDIGLELKSARDLRGESRFEVRNNQVTLCKTPVWIGGFDVIRQSSKYMNTSTGIYTCPITWEYRFDVYTDTKKDWNLYLCNDRQKTRQEVTTLMEDGNFESARDLSGESWFSVTNSQVTLCKTPVWIGGFDDIRQSSKYMNTSTGIYTCPITWEYRFGVLTDTKKDCNLYLCNDRQKTRQEVTTLMKDDNWGNFRCRATIYCKCEKNDSIWLEGHSTNVDRKVVIVHFFGVLKI